MMKFDDLKAEHQRLLAEHDSGGDETALLTSAQEYIEQIRLESEQVSDPRDRDQLRSYLRFWGAYVYDRTGTYPETSLRPALQVELPRKIKWDWRWGFAGALILLVIVVILSLLASTVWNVFFNIGASLEQSETPTVRAPTEEPAAVEASETAPLPSPSSTPVMASSALTPVLVASSTPVSVEITPDPRTATVTALFTQVTEKNTSEAPEIITVQPTEEILIPVTGGGGSLGSLLDAAVTGGDGGDWCTSRFLEVGVGVPEPVFGENASLTLWIDPAGSRQPLRQEISAKEPGAVIDLSALIRSGGYALLHLEHPEFPSKDVIFRYAKDCQAERLQVDYQVVDEWLSLEEEAPRNQNLSLEWLVCGA
jgi:hypothetical protein